MIRPATPADVSAVVAVVDAAYRPYIPRIGKLPGPMGDDYAAMVAAGQVWVLEHHNMIAGVLVLAETDAGFLLDNVAVRPDLHGQGHGRNLIAFAEAAARRRGFGAIQLYTHALMTENFSLYTRLGYAETRRVTEKGFDRVYMEKPLR